MIRRNFGKDTYVHEGVIMECDYIIPGHTLQDLMKIYDDATKGPDISPFSGNPSKWPNVAGVRAVVEVCLVELHDKKQG